MLRHRTPLPTALPRIIAADKVDVAIIRKQFGILVDLYSQYIAHLEAECPAEFQKNEIFALQMQNVTHVAERVFPTQSGFLNKHGHQVSFDTCKDHCPDSALIKKWYLLAEAFSLVDNCMFVLQHEQLNAEDIQAIYEACIKVKEKCAERRFLQKISAPRDESYFDYESDQTAGGIFLKNIVPVLGRLDIGFATDEQALEKALDEHIRAISISYSKHISEKGELTPHNSQKKTVITGLTLPLTALKSGKLTLEETINKIQVKLNETIATLTTHTNPWFTFFKTIFRPTAADDYVMQMQAALTLAGGRVKDFNCVPQNRI